ncbi:MAG: hypothetical protein HQ557_13555 [Bacteroidetes bacterium]|nr:hypothetical protein [Bacteroidota bacterium]
MVNKNAKKPISKYLKSIKWNIREKSREEQHALLRSLEEHIYEALEARFSISPTKEEIQSVIDEMETPESFQSNVSKKVPTYTEQQLGKWALIIVISGVVLPILVLIISELSGTPGIFGNISLLLGISLVVIGLAVGIVGRKSPLGKAAIISSAILIGGLSLVLPLRVVKYSSSDSSIITVEYTEFEEQKK